MSPRTRTLVIVGAAAAVAAGGTVALAVITSSDEDGKPKTETPLAGAPPLVLDLGVRVDPEAKALRRAERLYSEKRRAAAGRIFERYDSPEAEVGAVVSGWPAPSNFRREDGQPDADAFSRAVDATVIKIEALAEDRPRNSLVFLHLGYANVWAGKADEAASAWRRAEQAQPDSAAAQRADDALHPNFPSGQPFFVPSFRPPPGLDRLAPPAQLASLQRNARRQDAQAKLLYGLALQRLGHRISARRQYEAAARLAPRDADAQVAAAIGRFDKSRPSEAFSRLGPLTRRFPQAATVRFHLGLLLLWLAKSRPGSVDEAKRQLRLAQQEEPGSPLAREAKRLLDGLENVQTR
jgi:tetratricopeptide (TPR) repeat protein